jgi:hypothetical protein
MLAVLQVAACSARALCCWRRQLETENHNYNYYPQLLGELLLLLLLLVPTTTAYY